MPRWIVVATAWLACACGGGGKKEPSEPAAQPLENKAPAAEPAAAPAPPWGSTEAVMMKFQEFSAKMCACTDSKCAELVADEMTKWSAEMAKNQAEPPKMTEEDEKKASEIGTRMGECMQRTMGGSQPASP